MKWIVFVCLVLATSTVSGQNVNPDSFDSIYSERDVALDTNPDSAFWKRAKPVFAEVDPYGNPVPRYRTQIRSRWTHENLYLLFVCPYQELYLKPSPNTANETNQLWNWDVAEVFIGSNFHDIRRYKEFEVSPQGEWVDLDINLALPHHEEGWIWNSGFQVSARIDRAAKIWYGAMRIPFNSIDERAPAAGKVFRANLFRTEGPPERRQTITWRAPRTNTFHTPEQFGNLQLK